MERITQRIKTQRVKDLRHHWVLLNDELFGLMSRQRGPDETIPAMNRSIIKKVQEIKETEAAMNYILEIEATQ
jgi:hypothetical protein